MIRPKTSRKTARPAMKKALPELVGVLGLVVAPLKAPNEGT